MSQYKPLTSDGLALSEAGALPTYQAGPQAVPPVVVQPGTLTTTTVISQQPALRKQWSSGLCDCFDDMQSCCCHCFLPQWHLALVSKRMGEHCCVGCALGGLWPMRSAFRERHHIEGDMCNDCYVTTYCGPCAACQLHRELNHYGYPRRDGC